MKPFVRFAPSPTGLLEPLAVLSHSATDRHVARVVPYKSLHALAALFDFGSLSRAPARFDPEELKALNGRLLKELDYEEVTPRLRAEGIASGPDFWDAVRANLAIFSDVREWWRVVNGPGTPIVESPQLVETARELLPPEPWGGESWSGWTDSVKQATGAKGRALFYPLRLALTGREDGPEMKKLLPPIGSARSAARLEGQTA